MTLPHAINAARDATLALQSPVVSLLATTFNIKKIYFAPAQHVCTFFYLSI